MVRVQLLKVATNKIVATRIFDVEEPMGYVSPYSGVLATNRAGAELMRRIAALSVRYAR